MFDRVRGRLLLLVVALVVTTIPIVGATEPGVAEAATPIGDLLQFDDFSDLGGWTLNGRAAQLSNPVDVDGEAVLRLMDSVGNSGGSAVLTSPLLMTDAAGERESFAIEFKFRVTDPRNGGADGIVLLFGDSAELVGGIGGGIGYDGLTNTVAVEFDDWFNGGVDPNGNHVGIGINGNVDTVVDAALDVQLDDGDLWTAWVDYDGATQAMEVRANITGERPDAPVLSHVVDIVDVVGSNEVFIGFTSATGAASATFDLYGFGVDPTPDDVDPTPVANRAPVADAGTDQTQPEGSVVSLDGTNSTASNVPALTAAEEVGVLPGGTSIGAALNSLVIDAAGQAVLGGTADIGQSPGVADSAIVYIVDVSGSAAQRDGCGGDLNNNGSSNQMIDCEIATILAVHQEVLSSGTVKEVGLVTFSSGATARDLDPTSGQATLIAPDADADGNGVLDLEQVARTLGTGGATNFDAAVATACALLANSTASNRVALFMSDGERTRGGRPTNRLPCDPPVTFETFAIGTNATCLIGPVGYRLQDIADASGGSCVNVPNVDNLPSIVPQLVGSRLLSAELTIDGGAPIDVSDQLTPTPPFAGPALADFSVALPALNPGTHELCLTVFGSDVGGDGSVTVCTVLTEIDDDLSYSWRLVGSAGPPVFLTSDTSATPSFLAPDDGVYDFELTVTDSAGFSDTDRVSVSISNQDPMVTLDYQGAPAGDVTLVSGSFEDPGWLDTHTITIDWGDGVIDGPVDAAVQGSGWGSFYGSHVYADRGIYDVVVTVVDDDGGSAVDVASGFLIADPVGIWTNSETADPGISLTGATREIGGLVHSNSSIKASGSSLTVDGPVEYVTTFDHIPEHVELLDGAVQVAASPDPFVVDFTQYAPGGAVSTAVGDAYFDVSASCQDGRWQPKDDLVAGVYWVPCDAKLNGSELAGRVTIVAEGTISVSGSRPAFDPYWDGLLFASNSADANQAIQLSNSAGKFLGALYAPNGGIKSSSSGARFLCGIHAQSLKISGADAQVRGADCGRPDATVAPPLLVPNVHVEIAVDAEDATPGDTLNYESRLVHDGATLIVPAVIGVENVDESALTIGGYSYALEYFSVAAEAWLPLGTTTSTIAGFVLADPLVGGSALDLSTQPNASPGVAYSVDPIAGTTVEPGAYATWGSQAVVDLSPAEVDMLLDPAVTGGLRNRVEVEIVEPGVISRSLYRLGTDFVDDVRAQGGNVDDVQLNRLLSDGALRTELIPTLAPGASVVVADDYAVPALAPRGVTETDAGYLARLRNSDGAGLIGVAYAIGTGGVGQIVAPQVLVVSTEHVPVVAVELVGPTSVVIGSSVDYDIGLLNIGSSVAGNVEVEASAAAEVLAVVGGADTLAPGQIASASTTFSSPASSPGDLIAVRSEATWTDARGNVYGPVGATSPLQELLPASLGASLVDTLAVDADGDGRVSPGDTVRYTATITNAGDVALSNVVVDLTTDTNTGLVVGSVTAPQGVVTTGNVAGDTQASVSFASLAGSSTGVVTADVVVTDPFPDGVSKVQASARVVADGFDPVDSDDPSTPPLGDPTVTRVVVPYAALSALLSSYYRSDADQSGTVTSGDIFEAELVINSIGSIAVADVVATMPIPGGFNVVADSIEVSVGQAEIVGSDLVVTIDGLAALTSSVVSVDLAVANPLPLDPALRTTQATVSANGVASVLSDDPATDELDDPTVFFTATTSPGSGGGTSGGGGSTGGTGSEFPTSELSEVSLAEGTILTDRFEVTAQLAPPAGETLVGWTVSIAPADGGPGTQIAAGTDSTVLATIDPTLLANGGYRVVITSEVSGGGIAVDSVSFVVTGDFKPGRYTSTFQDMAVDVGGLSLAVNRTYDSFDKSTGDFGVGWKLDVADFRVSTNGALGAGQWNAEVCGSAFIFSYICYSSSGPKYVTVAWPDGETEIFDMTPARAVNFFPGLTTAEFTGRTGTTSQLAAVDASIFLVNGTFSGGLFGSSGVYDPRQFRLTDSAGTEYLLEVGVGLRQARDVNGNTVTVTPNGVTSSSGPSITYARDLLGRITTVTGPSGGVVRYGYDTSGDLISVTDPNGVATKFGYEGNHYLTSVGLDGRQPIQRLDYDANGRLASVTDAAGNLVTVDVDIDARTETTTGPDPRLTTIYTSDAAGNLVRTDDIFDGMTTTYRFEYDSAGRRTRTLRPDGSESTATYTAKGQLARLVDPDGVVTVMTYNTYGQPLTVTDDGIVVERRTYDPNGNLLKVESPDGTEATYEWSSAGDLLANTDRGGRRYTYTFDSNRFIASITGPAGTVAYTNDASGRTLTATTPDGSTLAWGYDSAGNVTSLLDGAGRTGSFEYNDQGEVTRIVDGLGDERRYEYDDAKRIVRTVDRDGVETLLSYGVYGQITERSSSDGLFETFEYDAIGRRTRASNATADVLLAWDEASNLVGETVVPADPTLPTVPLEFTVTDGGRPGGVVDPFGTTTFTYGDDGLLSQVIDSQLGSFGFQTDDLGRTVGIDRPNGVTTTYDYDGDRLASIATAAAGTDLRVASYSYDDAGNVESIVDLDGTHTFLYDDANRLISANRPESAGYTDESFAYDNSGNLTTWPGTPTGVAVYDAANRLLDDGSTTYVYDDEGHLTQSTAASGLITTYSWNARDQLISVVASNGLSIEYGYDAFGRRILESVDGNQTLTTYDGLNPRLVFGSDGELTTRAVHTGELGSLLGRTTNGTTVFPLVDPDLSVVADTASDGSLVDRYRYSAYGESIGDRPDTQAWHGMSPATDGGYLTFARSYDPGIGRFISEDPVLAVNAYAYSLGNPLSYSDPTGLTSSVEYSKLTANSSKNAPALCGQGSLIASLLADVATDFVFSAALSAVVPNGPGLYGFIDDATGKTYVGRSVDLRRRILEHIRNGKPRPGGRAFIISLAGQAADQIDVAEQLLINGCGGVGKAGQLANKINAINRKRRDQLSELGTTLLGLLS